MQEHDYHIFADYFQFYLTDNEVHAEMPEDVTSEDIQARARVAPHIVVVHTARNMTVPVTVQVHDSAPPLELSSWDHVVECPLDVPSGRIMIAGSTDYLPDAARFLVAPGSCRVRICFSGLGTLSEDGLDGNDVYTIMLWPAPNAELQVLKQYADA